MMEGLADYLGSAYEIILHSLEDYHHSVINIQNGYHSGRSVGAPITDLALNMLKEIENNGIAATGFYTSYNARNKSGERLKSSTIPILGDSDRVIGILCINMYMDSPLSEILQSLIGSKSEQPQSENYASNINDTITEAVMEAKNQVMFNSNIAAVNKNKALIQILNDKGIFNIKDSVVRVAKVLGISKNTVYLHLRSINSGTDTE